MDRINRILEHPIFKECVKKNEMAEAKRSFCHHDIEHLCAVARIAMLLNLEEGLGSIDIGPDLTTLKSPVVILRQA